MTEPTSATTATAVISAFSLSAIYPNLENGLILGALCGSILLVLNENEISVIRRILLFFISFTLGLLLAELSADLISLILPESVKHKTPVGLGSLVASAISIKLLIWMIKHIDDLLEQLNIFRGKKP